jgi:hypothetical protein
MTDIREHLPPASATAAPAAAVATTRQGRVVGPDGIQGLAALYVVLYHIFLRAWSGYPGANHAPSWATWLSYGRVRSRCSSCCPASRWASARRVNARAMVGLVADIVVTIGLLGPHVPLMNSALATAGRWRDASRASGPRNQAGGRCRPARQRPVADRARPASRPGPPLLPGPGDSATRSGSC